MNNYFLDLNVFLYKDVLYTTKSNLERIIYLFGELKINLIVPKIIKVSIIDTTIFGVIDYNVTVGNNSFLKKINLLKDSNRNFILLTGNFYFITTLFSFIFSLKRFELIYIGSISNSYFYAERKFIHILKYFISLFLEFFSFLLASKIYSAGGNFPNKFLSLL